MTNGDKIRSMTDEELAEWLDRISNQEREDWKPIGCCSCINHNTHHSDKSNIGTGLYGCNGCEFKNGLIHWLKSSDLMYFL